MENFAEEELKGHGMNIPFEEFSKKMTLLSQVFKLSLCRSRFVEYQGS